MWNWNFSRQSLGKRCTFVLEFEINIDQHYLEYIDWNYIGIKVSFGSEENEVFSAVLKVL